MKLANSPRLDSGVSANITPSYTLSRYSFPNLLDIRFFRSSGNASLSCFLDLVALAGFSFGLTAAAALTNPDGSYSPFTPFPSVLSLALFIIFLL
nr:MAG TPA_asm: hypothetical protein [Bacteriophage sp.]